MLQSALLWHSCAVLLFVTHACHCPQALEHDANELNRQGGARPLTLMLGPSPTLWAACTQCTSCLRHLLRGHQLLCPANGPGLPWLGQAPGQGLLGLHSWNGGKATAASFMGAHQMLGGQQHQLPPLLSSKHLQCRFLPEGTNGWMGLHPSLQQHEHRDSVAGQEEAGEQRSRKRRKGNRVAGSF